MGCFETSKRSKACVDLVRCRSYNVCGVGLAKKISKWVEAKHGTKTKD